MRILICSDGSEQAENALRFGTLIASKTGAEVTLLGVVEKPSDEAQLLIALRRGLQIAREKNVNIELLTRSGEPVIEIRKHTSGKTYDVVLIGAAHKGHAGPFVMSVRAYKLINIMKAPVLVVAGERDQLKRILICSGGGAYIDTAIDLAARIALPLGATVTLFHVLPHAPAVFDGLIDYTEDPQKLLTSSSVLGRNLNREKETLENAGVRTEIVIRYGDVGQEILEQVQLEDYDLIVAGSSPIGSAVRTYLMGNVTSEIVNRSRRPVLVVRCIVKKTSGGIFKFFRRFKKDQPTG